MHEQRAVADDVEHRSVAGLGGGVATSRDRRPRRVLQIGTFEFEWQPAVYAGAEFTPGQRGTDYRLEDTSGRI